MQKLIREVGWFFSCTLGTIFKVLLTIFVIGAVTAAICITVFAVYIDRYIKPALETVNVADMTLNYTSVVCAVDSETGEEILGVNLESTPLVVLAVALSGPFVGAQISSFTTVVFQRIERGF